MRVSPYSILVSAAAVAASLTACGPVAGSGAPGTLTLPVQEVRGVRFEGALSAEIPAVPGTASWGDARLVVEWDQNLLELVRTEVSEGTLRVWTDGRWTSKEPCRVRLECPPLAWISASGAITARADSLSADAVHVISEGASSVKVGTVAGKTVNLSTRGASRIEVAGEATDTLVARAQGASAIEAAMKCDKAALTAESASSVKGPVAREAKVTTTGTSEVELDATERLTADSMGVSSVLYGGKPEIGGSRGEATTFERKPEK